MKTRLFLFDLDGTLVDSLADIAGALNHALVSAGLAPQNLEVVRGLVGEGVHRLVEKAVALQPAPARSVDATALAEVVRGYYHDHPCVASRIYPGIGEVLEALRADRHRHIVVLTNKPGDVARALLDQLSLRDFDAVVGDNDGYPRKPAPDAALALAARFGVSPAETIIVGDGIPDLQLARAAGLPSAAALWGYTPRPALAALGPTYLLDSPGELLSYV